jgi:hypothetical protein
MRFTFGFPSIAGVLFNLPIVLQFIKWLLDWKGRYDAASSLSEAGREPMTEFLSYIPLWFYPVAVAGGIGLVWWDSKRSKREITVSFSPLAAALFATLLTLCAWIWYFYDRSRGPILWTWDASSPIAVGGSSDDIRVDAFQAKGINRWDEIIYPIKAFIRSDTTGQVLPLFFQGNGPVEPSKVTIPAGRQFTVSASLPPIDPKYSSSVSRGDFTKVFPSFTFVFEYEGSEPYKVSFRESDVAKHLDRAESAVKQSLRRSLPGSPSFELRK